MVIKGTKRNRPKPLELPERVSPTDRIKKISVLKRQLLKEDALDLLHELAKLVTPIMNKYDFQVGLLCEMIPKSANLLGLNINGGQKILIRLRHHNDNLNFLSKSELIGTFLHELTHNRYGPHNNSFYSFLDTLTRDFESMMSQNSFNIFGQVTLGNIFGNNSMLNKQIGNSTSSDMGHRLGNSKDLVFNEVNRLGSNGDPIPRSNMRNKILQATERRLNDAKKCHEMINDDTVLQSMQDSGEIYISDDESDLEIVKKPKFEIIIISDDE